MTQSIMRLGQIVVYVRVDLDTEGVVQIEVVATTPSPSARAKLADVRTITRVIPTAIKPPATFRLGLLFILL